MTSLIQSASETILSGGKLDGQTVQQLVNQTDHQEIIEGADQLRRQMTTPLNVISTCR